MAILNDTNPFNKRPNWTSWKRCWASTFPARALRTKLRKRDAAYKLTAERHSKNNWALPQESVLKKLEINEKLRELDELHRMVDGIPPEILQAAKQVAAHKQQER